MLNFIRLVFCKHIIHLLEIFGHVETRKPRERIPIGLPFTATMYHVNLVSKKDDIIFYADNVIKTLFTIFMHGS